MKGHIRERSPGRWAIILDQRDASTGKRRRKWHSFKGTKRQAHVKAAQLVTEMEAGTYVEPSKITVAEFLDRWLLHMQTQVSPRTHERYAELARKNVIPQLGTIVLSKLQAARISQAYADALQSGRRKGSGGLSPRTVHHMHRVLKKALNQAVAWNILARNPAALVTPPKVQPRRLDTYDMAQTAALLAAIRGTRMFIPALLAVLCGLRRGEIAALRWRRVALDAGKMEIVESAEQTKAGVRYKEPKGGRARNVALSATVVEELKAWRLRQAEEFLRLGTRPDGETFVVTQADSSALQPRSLTHEWVRVLGTTTLPRTRFHDLRHAHATHMLASGVHPKVASERLGHSKVGITLDLYSHVLPGMQEDAAAKVDAAFKAAQKNGS